MTDRIEESRYFSLTKMVNQIQGKNMSQQEELYEAESGQRQHFAFLEHNEAMNALVIKRDMALVDSLHPKITKDGNQWCVLCGDNLQEGIAGFGNTIYAAILDFNSQFYKEATDD